MMKILHVITGLENGGAEAVLFRLCTTDKRNSHRVVSLMGDGKYGQLLLDANVDVECLNLQRGRLSLKGTRRLYRIIKGSSCDILQTWMPHADFLGGVIGKFARTPNVIWTVHHSNYDSTLTKVGTRFLVRVLSYLSPLVPSLVISCSRVALESRLSEGYRPRQALVIPNGYDDQFFTPDRRDQRAYWKGLELGRETLVVGMVARFDAQKDHKGLLSAIAQLPHDVPDFSLLLVGPGMSAENAMLNAWIEEAGLTNRVFLLGESVDVPGIMANLDLHVLASAYGEAFPNAVAESMAAGTASIVTDVGDSADIVGETGWVVPPRNPTALAAMLDSVLRLGRKHLRAKGWTARERVQTHFSLEKMLNNYGSAYTSLNRVVDKAHKES